MQVEAILEPVLVAPPPEPGSAAAPPDPGPGHDADTDSGPVPVPDPVSVVGPGTGPGVGTGPEVVVIAVRPAPGPDAPVALAPGDEALLGAWGVDLARRLARARATGARSEVTWIDLERDQPRAVLALGLGSGSTADLRRSAAAAVRRLRGVDEVLVLAARDLDAEAVRAFTEGLYLATGAVTWASSPPPAPPSRVRIVVGDLADGEPAVADGQAHAKATLAARALIHTPGNLKDPESIAVRAREVAADRGLALRVWEPGDLARDGFGGLLAVGGGSDRGPRLVQLSWPAGAAAEPPPDGGVPGDRPPAATEPRHIVLVGKGITFDSGGLSLKRPADLMVGMKTDMSGAAVVCAVLAALPGRLPDGLRVTGLLCLAENMPGAAALRPGDVVTHHGGLTSEVVNTDAEGRLVLGDGLDYAVDDLAADVVVDIATLTGAATLGLGRRYAALYSTSDGLAAALHRAGEAAGEQMWRMPLHEDYAELITSTVADQANASEGVGWAPSPGSITAALFLRRFVADTPWAHLDIAGTGRSDAERDDLPKGGTGFGARALLRWLEAGAPC
jgi:leucyl aminopeptidase